jgi:protein-tyrosine kinase
MSRLFEALKRMEAERRSPGEVAPEPAQPIEFLSGALAETVKAEEPGFPQVDISPASRLVALRDRQGLGAEKFRALATRIGNLRRQREFKSLQVTSSVVGEGKTLVAGNLAATLAVQSGARVLLVEGDLHRPALGPLFGLSQLRGLSHWWSGQDEDISRYLYKLGDMSLCLLSGGKACEEPSQILQSSRFATAFSRLADGFDWIIVDSAPMLPTVTANLWSRLVDGTLLVVREGVAPVKDLKRGLEALDSPKLIGIVVNEASAVSRANYRYYSDTSGVPNDKGQ